MNIFSYIMWYHAELYQYHTCRTTTLELMARYGITFEQTTIVILAAKE